MKIVAFIQARMGSTRFPGKVMQNILGRPVINHVIRAAQKMNVDSISVLTTNRPEEYELIYYVEKGMSHPGPMIGGENKGPGFDIIRAGEPLQCFSWFVNEGIKQRTDYIVRICGDSPCIVPDLANKLIDFAIERKAKYASYQLSNGIPAILSTMGVFVEVIELNALCMSLKLSDVDPAFILEHVTPGLYMHGQYLTVPKELEKWGFKLSIDIPQDLDYVKDFVDTWPYGLPLNYMDIYHKLINNEALRLTKNVQPYTHSVYK